MKLPPELPLEKKAVLVANPARYLQRWSAFAKLTSIPKSFKLSWRYFRFHHLIPSSPLQRASSRCPGKLESTRAAYVSSCHTNLSQSFWFLRGLGGFIACFGKSTPLSYPVKLPSSSYTGETLPTAAAGGAALLAVPPACAAVLPACSICICRSWASKRHLHLPVRCLGPLQVSSAGGPPLPPSAASDSRPRVESAELSAWAVPSAWTGVHPLLWSSLLWLRLLP